MRTQMSFQDGTNELLYTELVRKLEIDYHQPNCHLMHNPASDCWILFEDNFGVFNNFTELIDVATYIHYNGILNARTNFWLYKHDHEWCIKEHDKDNYTMFPTLQAAVQSDLMQTLTGENEQVGRIP